MPRSARSIRRAALVAAALLCATEARAGRWRFQSPVEPGVYAVSHGVFEVTDPDRDGRTIPVHLWVPVEPDEAGAVPTHYALLLGIGPTSSVSTEDAPMSPTNGFPLVVYSHGGGGLAVEAATLMESLASHGIVAAAPSHVGGTFEDLHDTVEVLRRNRILDVRLVIDALLARAADPDDPLYVRIHPKRIGVVGYSFGGWTAGSVVSGHSEPEVGPDIPPDPRVRAAACIARGNGTYQSPDAELAAIDVPLLLMTGTQDVDAPIDPNVLRPWELATGRPIVRADVVAATHAHFSWQCNFGEALIAAGATLAVVESTFRNLGGSFVADCRDVELPIAEAQRIRDWMVTAFFLRHLLEDRRYEEFLTPAWMAEHEPAVQLVRRDDAPAR